MRFLIYTIICAGVLGLVSELSGISCLAGARKHCELLHRSHRGAQNGCSSPLSATGALDWTAPAPAQCPQSARRSCSSPRSMSQGTRSGCSSLCSVPQCVPSSCSSLCSVPQVPGAVRTVFRTPAWCHRSTRACFCFTGRSKRRSKKLFESFVLRSF